MKKITIKEHIKINTAITSDGCWGSTLAKLRGYTQIRVNGIKVYFHRAAYEYFKGSIPKGLQLDHLCRNRHCVNPDHLEPVTPKENTNRSPIHDGVKNRNKTKCKRNHDFNALNTGTSVWKGKVRRFCKKCHICYE